MKTNKNQQKPIITNKTTSFTFLVLGIGLYWVATATPPPCLKQLKIWIIKMTEKRKLISLFSNIHATKVQKCFQLILPKPFTLLTLIQSTPSILSNLWGIYQLYESKIDMTTGSRERLGILQLSRSCRISLSIHTCFYGF